MEHILLPTTIEFHDTDRAHVGKLVVTPCHKGYGTTLGNALRRVLLSSLPGAAVESVKINGVPHEFSGIEGVQEDVIEIILNLKQLAVRSFSEAPVILTLTKKGKGKVTAKDFDKNSDVEIINPELQIATLTGERELEMEVTVGRGRGYVPVSEKETKNLALGTIAIDSLYTPIRDVGYDVEMTRVGDVTDYEKLTMTIETNGTVSPKEAIEQSTKIIMDHFTLIQGMSDTSSARAAILDAATAEEVPEPVVTETASDEAEEGDEETEVKKKKPVKKAKKKA